MKTKQIKNFFFFFLFSFSVLILAQLTMNFAHLGLESFFVFSSVGAKAQNDEEILLLLKEKTQEICQKTSTDYDRVFLGSLKKFIDDFDDFLFKNSEILLSISALLVLILLLAKKKKIHDLDLTIPVLFFVLALTAYSINYFAKPSKEIPKSYKEYNCLVLKRALKDYSLKLKES